MSYPAPAIFRYIVVVHPLAARYVAREHTTRIIAGIWLWSLVLKSPILLSLRVVTIPSGNGAPDSHVCLNANSGTTAWYVYDWLQLLYQYFIPVMLSSVLYVNTCRTLWSSGSGGSSMAHETTDRNRSATQARQVKKLVEQRKRPVKVMVVCFALFFLCYTPEAIYQLVKLLMLVVRRAHVIASSNYLRFRSGRNILGYFDRSSISLLLTQIAPGLVHNLQCA